MVEKNAQSTVPPGMNIRSSTLARMADVPLRQPETDVPVLPLSVLEYNGIERRRMTRSPVTESQRRLPDVAFLEPECLPTTAQILAALSAEVRSLCADEIAPSASDVRRAVKALSHLVPAFEPGETCDIAFLIATGQHADGRVLDQFFRISRVSASHPAMFLQSLFRALQVLRTDLEEAPTTLEVDAVATLAGGLKAVIAAGLGLPYQETPFDWTPADVPRYPDFPARRWIRGHQIFAVLTQGLIFAFDAMAAADSDEDGMMQAADLAARLMRACACALQFTGDFPKRAYEDLIRVSMERPFQPEGFSGLMSSDHRHLVSRMRSTRPTMDLLLACAPERHAAIVSGLASVYDSHKCVCGTFVGTDKSSLLMARETGRSAVDQLERFKQSRLRTLSGESPGQGG